MVARHDITWLAPDPLWTRERLGTANIDNGAFNRPAILRFRSDEFMEELLGTLSFEPERLGDWLALPETWREPQLDAAVASRISTQEPRSALARELNGLARQAAVTPPVTAAVDPVDRSALPFKLFQPAQQRFYILTASLVCRMPGLPDRAVNSGKQEQVSFVVRRVVARGNDVDAAPEETVPRDEYAYVATDKGFGWRLIEPDKLERLQPEEERLPMFGVDFESGGNRRHLFGALVPVGRREAYASATLAEPDPDNPPEPVIGAPVSALGALFSADVAAPWRNLVEHAEVVESTLTATSLDTIGSDPEKIARDAAKTLRDALVSAQTASWYILLDLALFLKRYTPTVWGALQSGGNLTAGSAEALLLQELRATDLPMGLRNGLNGRIGGSGELAIQADYQVANDLADALARAYAARDQLESAEDDLDIRVAPDHWPDFLFPLGHPGVLVNETTNSVEEKAGQRGAYPGPPADSDTVDEILERIDLLVDLVEELTVPPGVQLPDITPEAARWDKHEPWFVLRCVYERPNCGPFEPAVVSQATQAFRMASFFDPDAPQREVRIPMPLDVSTGGLRKYQKNARFVMSDLFCGKVTKIRKMTFADLVLSVLPWPFHKDLPSVGPPGPCDKGDGGFGLIFSLSIPIVTLCAMILLIIMVALFDMFFRWIPYLFVAIPVPGLRAKAETNP